MNTWRIDVTYNKERHVVQGHLDPITELAEDSNYDGRGMAEVEIQALISGPFSNTRIVSAVRLNCRQETDTICLAQEQATQLAMDGLREGWEILQTRVAKGHFPGCGQ